MKKITSLLLFLLSVGIFLWLSSYTSEWPFDYHISQFVEYLFYWVSTLFIVSLFSLTLDDKKYKKWKLLSLIYLTVSILCAWQTGDGNGSILSFDGEMITWFSVGLYFVISVVYFITQYLKNKKQSTLVT